jgi:hypothetical protein
MNLTDTQTQKFSRYEFKYLLNFEESERLESEVRNFMRFDGHAHAADDNRYFVRSLYFDNMNATNYYEKIDGAFERRKFRVRTYSQQPDENTPLFLEEKGRHNQRTFKNRVEITQDQLNLLLNSDARSDLMQFFPNVPLVERFVFDCERRQLLPRVLVDYRRRPYVSDFDLNFRITFDSYVRATPTDALFPRNTI